MGVSIDAFIEWDPCTEGEPFLVPNGQVLSLVDYADLRGGKDNAFIGSLCGVRAPRDPLFPCRGLPPNVSTQLAETIEELYDVSTQKVGWLTLGEVRLAMAHQGVVDSDLSLAARWVLHLMLGLETRLGPGRVRLVFGVE